MLLKEINAFSGINRYSQYGDKFYAINAGRFQRRFTRFTFWSIGKVPIGFVQALVFFPRASKYNTLFWKLCGCSGSIGWLGLGIPIVTHEQTVKGGLSNRFISALLKDCRCLEHTLKDYPQEKAILVGNPVRAELLKLKENELAGRSFISLAVIKVLTLSMKWCWIS